MAETNQFLALLEQNAEEIKTRVADWMTPERFIGIAKAITKSPDLQRIAQKNPQSLLACILEAADAGVEINTVNHHAVIIPYGDEAQLQIMWQGLAYRLINAGVVKKLYAELVYQNDDFDEISGSVRKLVHKPKRFGDRGKLVGVYAVCTFPDDSTDHEIMEVKDIDAVKSAASRMFSRRKKPEDGNATESPAWRFFPGEMWKKSVIRRLAKRLQGRMHYDPKLDAVLKQDQDFDAETTATPLDGEDVPGMEDLKQAGQDVNGGGADGQSSSKEAASTPAADPKLKVRIQLPDDQQAKLLAQGKKMGLKHTAMFDILQAKFGVSDPESLFQDQFEAALMAFQEAAAPK